MRCFHQSRLNRAVVFRRAGRARRAPSLLTPLSDALDRVLDSRFTIPPDLLSDLSRLFVLDDRRAASQRATGHLELTRCARLSVVFDFYFLDITA
jgi:hypothetical protein